MSYYNYRTKGKYQPQNRFTTKFALFVMGLLMGLLMGFNACIVMIQQGTL